MKHKLLKLTLALSTLSAAMLMLVACSSGKSSSSASQKTTPIVIAADGATKPFDYTQNNQLTGYDIAVAKAVFKDLPQYKPSFKLMDFDSIATSIDNGRVQVGANDFGWTPERAEKYYFSAPISKSNNAVAVKKDAPTYKKLSDLAGLKTEGTTASNFTASIQKFNKTTDKPIQISYVAGNTPFSNRLTDVVNGKADFMLYDAISIKNTIKDLGYAKQLKVENISTGAGDPAHDGYEYLLLPKTKAGKTLQADINKSLKKLQANGTLKTLSEKYLGGDFVPAAQTFK